MKYLFLLLLLCSFTYTSEPKHIGLKGVIVLSASTQEILGRNAGYYVKFKNNSKKDIIGIKWKAIFTDNFGEVKGSEVGKWQSGNFINPIKPGKTTIDIESVWIKGATRVKIIITKII